MSRKETIEYVSPMQGAFMNAAIRSPQTTKLVVRVKRVADRVKLHREPAVNTKLSFRTAQKLLAEGVIE